MSDPSPRMLDEAMQRFLHSLWHRDVRPLLTGKRSEQREKSARLSGALAGTSGLLIDKLLGLRGRPFARAFSVLGSRFGAMLPDAWDWNWLRSGADKTQRAAVQDAAEKAASCLPELEALQLFGLSPAATPEQAKAAWRSATLRWHPDRAPDADARSEFTLRFLVYQSAYEQLLAAYETGRLPHPPGAAEGRGDAL